MVFSLGNGLPWGADLKYSAGAKPRESVNLIALSYSCEDEEEVTAVAEDSGWGSLIVSVPVTVATLTREEPYTPEIDIGNTEDMLVEGPVAEGPQTQLLSGDPMESYLVDEPEAESCAVTVTPRASGMNKDKAQIAREMLRELDDWVTQRTFGEHEEKKAAVMSVGQAYGH